MRNRLGPWAAGRAGGNDPNLFQNSYAWTPEDGGTITTTPTADEYPDQWPVLEEADGTTRNTSWNCSYSSGFETGDDTRLELQRQVSNLSNMQQTVADGFTTDQLQALQFQAEIITTGGNVRLAAYETSGRSLIVERTVNQQGIQLPMYPTASSIDFCIRPASTTTQTTIIDKMRLIPRTQLIASARDWDGVSVDSYSATQPTGWNAPTDNVQFQKVSATGMLRIDRNGATPGADADVTYSLSGLTDGASYVIAWLLGDTNGNFQIEFDDGTTNTTNVVSATAAETTPGFDKHTQTGSTATLRMRPGSSTTQVSDIRWIMVYEEYLYS